VEQNEKKSFFGFISAMTCLKASFLTDLCLNILILVTIVKKTLFKNCQNVKFNIEIDILDEN